MHARVIALTLASLTLWTAIAPAQPPGLPSNPGVYYEDGPNNVTSGVVPRSAAAASSIKSGLVHESRPGVLVTAAPPAGGADAPKLAPEAVCDECHNPWRPCTSIGIRTWFSWADSQRSHVDDPALAGIDVFPHIKWRSMASEVIELNLSAIWFDRLLANISAGAGAISSGRMQQHGFVNGDADLALLSLHPAIDDDLVYADFDIGWRFYHGPYFLVDAMIGYQYWRERYVAEGGVTVPPAVVFAPGPFITEEFTWDGFRIGCQGMLYPCPRCVVKGRVMCMPFTHLRIEDVHHQTPELRQDPSIIDRSAGGFGVMAEIRASYCLIGGLYVELGYRIWDIDADDGETLVRFADPPYVQLPFIQGRTTRHGLLFGFSYHF